MTTEKPFSQSCENNKKPILQIIKTVFHQPATVWEIGSGTGQHACHFAENLPHLAWQPTDRAENLAGIHLWRDEAQLANLLPPLSLDVADLLWPCDCIDAVFTANTLHIMSSDEVRLLFERLATYLSTAATMCIYGPFNYAGIYTSESNARFDLWLKERDAMSGIKDFEEIMRLAETCGLALEADNAMPANNRLLVLRKRA
ncbi:MULTISPECIES: DUF938 domain-containing protein [Methylomonas]|uniref:Methylase n=2 Tax=Methylomonas TaxID=416 RepID=A0A140E5Q6_9GAMM|nr:MULTISPECIES: DUF938 domain-containing protein [Methylomonas]AMK78730.1 methylase [Methylomonas denitrificans]OAH99011.1 methylase [Methylomonas methanica]TCV83516.1 uncharacterized protein DUF938 [Methylomonas methanica]